MPPLAVVAIATAAAGATSAYGAYQQGQSQKDMYNYQAQAALLQRDQTEKVAQANRTGVQDQAAKEAIMLGRQGSMVQGSQRASMGASGTGGSVTAANVATDTFNKMQLDQMTLQYNANVKAWGITNQANNEEWRLGIEADQAKAAAKNAAKAGNIKAIATLLGTAVQVGSMGIGSATAAAGSGGSVGGITAADPLGTSQYSASSFMRINP